MKDNKGSAIVLLLIIVVLAIVILSGAYYFIKKEYVKNNQEIVNSHDYIKEIDANSNDLIKNGVYTNKMYSWRINSSNLFDVKENPEDSGLIYESKKKTKEGEYGTNNIYPLYSINISTIKKENFVSMGSKIGMIRYEEKYNSLIDTSDDLRCLPVEEKYKSINLVEYAGSTMTDPVYHRYAVVTNDSFIVLIDIYSYVYDEILDNEVSRIISTFTLPVGVSSSDHKCNI